MQGSLTVTPTALIITAGNASRAFGLANPLLNNVSASGFANGDTLASLAGALACTTTATPASPAGTYPITCTGLSSPNYSITFLPGTLTIKADALTVAANNAARQYGSTNPSFTASFSGFVNGDTPASLGGSLACTTPATPTSSVSGGPYPINCSGLTSANYAISYVPGALIITPAPLTVAANNAARPYGSKNPAFTGSVAGLLNSDPVTASFGTSATPPSSVGTYPITPTVIGAQPVLGNYSIGLINGTLTVGPESTSLSVTLNPATISAGQSTIATVMLTAPDMVIPIDPSVLGSITLTSTVATDVLSNNGVCTPLPSATPGVASCTLTVTSAEPNGRTLVANFAGSASLAAATGSVNLIVTTPVEGQRSCISSDFLNIRINGGDYIWFNSIFRIRFVHRQKINISFSGSSVQFRYRDRNGKLINVNQSVPDAHIVIDPSVRFGSTTFDSLKQVWITTIPWDLDDNAFLSGMSWRVPASGLPSDVEPVTWCGRFASDVPGMDIGWRWAAAAYSSFSSNDAVLGVKPMDTDRDGPFGNDDRAGTPDNFKRFVIPGARGWGGRNYTGSYSRAKEID